MATSAPQTSRPGTPPTAAPPAPPSSAISLQSCGSQDGEELGLPTTKKRGKLFLTEEQEQDVAEWYQAHEILYSKARKEYKDVKMKSRLYEEKAASLNVDPCYTGIYIFHCIQWTGASFFSFLFGVTHAAFACQRWACLIGWPNAQPQGMD